MAAIRIVVRRRRARGLVRLHCAMCANRYVASFPSAPATVEPAEPPALAGDGARGTTSAAVVPAVGERTRVSRYGMERC